MRHCTKLGATFDGDFNLTKQVSLTYRSCFYYMRDIFRNWPYIYLSVAKTNAAALITSRLNYYNSHLYNIISKDILQLQCVQIYLARVVTRSPRFSHSIPLLNSLHCSITPSFSNSAILLIILFLLENLHIYVPCFL